MVKNIKKYKREIYIEKHTLRKMHRKRYDKNKRIEIQRQKKARINAKESKPIIE